jgi:YbbR domain-containing protein
LKEFFTTNLGLKLFSLFLAIMLELYLNSPDQWVAETLSVPVEVSNIARDMMIVSPFIDGQKISVNVRFRGPKSQVKQVKDFSPKFFVEVPSNIVDRTRIILNEKQLRLPTGVEVSSIDPESIELRFERVHRKELLIKLTKQGTVADGYQITSEEIQPERVFAFGPESELAGVESVVTDLVDISGLDQPKRLEVGLVSVGRLTRLNVNVVGVKLNVSPIMSEKTFSSVGVKIEAGKGFAASVEPSNLKVVVSGPVQRLNALTANDIQIIADAKALPSGRHNLKPNVILPNGLTLVSIQPNELIVSVLKNTNSD